MTKAKVQLFFSTAILVIAGILFWIQLKPAPEPPVSEFRKGQIAFKKHMEDDTTWYRQADAHGVPYTKYIPMEIAASNATIQEYQHVGKGLGWGSLSLEERTRITGDINKKADAARQAMRASYYTKPFNPHW